ncbi:hypothetical protein P7K49_022602 [Saguinus oedipus]|uniref:Uncharacterized protein n=1 Tax=Saguinus oedipus TaxID=9490 RepID=A0ABQ9UJA2_SAGOE|nr:hypothetical protein P7K49_022602 [Saguinus oedipus]
MELRGWRQGLFHVTPQTPSHGRDALPDPHPSRQPSSVRCTGTAVERKDTLYRMESETWVPTADADNRKGRREEELLAHLTVPTQQGGRSISPRTDGALDGCTSMRLLRRAQDIDAASQGTCPSSVISRYRGQNNGVPSLLPIRDEQLSHSEGCLGPSKEPRTSGSRRSGAEDRKCPGIYWMPEDKTWSTTKSWFP